MLGYRPREVDEAIGKRDAAIADWDAALRAATDRLAGAERIAADRELELQTRSGELTSSGERVDELEGVATWLADRVVERERELRELRTDMERLRTDGEEGTQALAALAEELTTLRRLARGQATRMRLRALRDAGELLGRAAKVERGVGEPDSELVESVREAIERIGAAEEREEDPLEWIASTNGHVERESGELFDGLVEVEVGPLSDFSQLVGFEDAAAGIGATSEVSVKRFTQGRATVAMRFKHPVELLRELEGRAPFEFEVRDMRADRLVLDVSQ